MYIFLDDGVDKLEVFDSSDILTGRGFEHLKPRSPFLWFLSLVSDLKNK